MSDDPSVIYNPPGQAVIGCRAVDFAALREALLAPLSGETQLSGWQPADGDLGLQLLEWWAYLGDVLAFYNERIANESYLRTAQLPANVARIATLIGYQPRPAIAAVGQVAALRRATRLDEPLALPAGMALSSTPTPGVAAQTFQTSTASSFAGITDVQVIAPPDNSLLRTVAGAPTLLLAGRVTSLRQGDQLLLIERGWAGADDNWAAVSVGTLTPETDPNSGVVNTRVAFAAAGFGPQSAPTHISISHIQPGLGVLSGVVSHAIADETLVRNASDAVAARDAPNQPRAAGATQTASLLDEAALARPTFLQQGVIARLPIIHFAPPRQAGEYRLLRSTQTAALWTQTTIEPSAGTGSSPALTVHLAAAVRGIAAGDSVLLVGSGGAVAAASVSQTSEQLVNVPYPAPPSLVIESPIEINPEVLTASDTDTAPTPPAPIAVSHTVLGLTAPSDDVNVVIDFSNLAAVTLRYGYQDVGTPIATPATTLSSLPATVNVAGDFTPTAGGQQAFVEDVNGAGIPVTVTDAGGGALTLNATPATPATFSLSAPLTLLLDIVDVSRGVSVSGELLGSGDATIAGQTFVLAKSPLTYLAQGAGYASTLTIAVGGAIWSAVESFYAQPPDATVWVVTQLPDGTSQVRFGDGINGARLPSGAPIVADYRYGAGAASPPAGRLTTVAAPQPNLAAIHNPIAVAPGADAEAPDSIATNAPASVLTFGRAISADDYEAVAALTPGVSRVRAYWTWDAGRQRSLVKVYVGDDEGAASLARSALAGAGDPNRPVSVVAATPISLSVSCTLEVAADVVADYVLAAAQAALADPGNGLFSAARMAIGAPLFASQVQDALMVAGAVAVHGLGVGGDMSGVGPTWLLDPGEGSFFVLAASNITTAVSDG